MAVTLVSIGSTNPVGEVGGTDKIMVADNNVRETLSSIHTELRKMNLYNEIMSDNKVKDSDLEKE